MPRREVPLDAASILRSLGEHGVEYILIGGLAVQAHGHVRTTQDVDIVPAPEPSNLKRLSSALRALDARAAGAGGGSTPHGLSPEAIAAAGTLTLDTRAGGLDIHLRPPGAKPYEELRRRTLDVEVVGQAVAIAGRDDLIAMKRAAGRPLDRGDVLALTEGEAGKGSRP